MFISLARQATWCDSPPRIPLTRWAKSVFTTSETIRSAPSQDGTVLLDVHHGRMFSINPVGSRILDLVKEGRDEAQIADEIVRVYGIAIEMARTDVHQFLKALCAHRIVIAMAGSQNRA
jgi:Coenzyme PQQ synthesis protein D (PqqD)